VQKKYLRFVMILLLLFCFTGSSVALAAGEQADSPGTPGEKPLSFTGITLVANGENVADAADIPLRPSFKLGFDKNVVNSLYWENNSKCFGMATDSNQNVPIKVTKIDDTIDFAQRQNIFVEPVNALQPGTTYKLSISPNLMAKNGVATLGGTTDGKGVTIAFKTTVEAVKPTETTTTTKPETEASNSPAEQQSSETSDSQTSANSEEPSSGTSADTGSQAAETANPNTASQPEQASPGNSTGLSGLNMIAIIGAILVIGWVAVEIYVRRKRNRKG